jgi:hypothetical protein
LKPASADIGERFARKILVKITRVNDINYE